MGAVQGDPARPAYTVKPTSETRNWRGPATQQALVRSLRAFAQMRPILLGRRFALTRNLLCFFSAIAYLTVGLMRLPG
jgi:hypothetical protein